MADDRDYKEFLDLAAPRHTTVSTRAMKALERYMQGLREGLEGQAASVLLRPGDSWEIKRQELEKVLNDLSDRFRIANPYYEVFRVEKPPPGHFEGYWQWEVVFVKQTTQTYVSGKSADVSSAPCNSGWGGY
jgi:hypothetical protein